MIIDSHAHLWAPPGLDNYRAWLFDTKGAEGRGSLGVSDEEIGRWADENVTIQDVVGTGMQLVSPRPFRLAHSEEPAIAARWWVEATNDVVAATVARHPSRFRGVAGLPQHKDTPVTSTLDELERCVTELGFVGALVNPDPGEGAGWCGQGAPRTARWSWARQSPCGG